jgi:hypothetical protein
LSSAKRVATLSLRGSGNELILSIGAFRKNGDFEAGCLIGEILEGFG